MEEVKGSIQFQNEQAQCRACADKPRSADICPSHATTTQRLFAEFQKGNVLTWGNMKALSQMWLNVFVFLSFSILVL